MKKSDLVASKHVVKYRDGSVRIVGENGVLLDSEMKKQNTLNCYDESLKDSGCMRGLDIVSVYKLTEVWKREEPTITDDERTILRNLPDEYRFIARDSDDVLYVYEDAPEKGNISWKVYSGSFDKLVMSNKLFQMIRWEDEEPWKIEDLLKLDVKNDG